MRFFILVNIIIVSLLYSCSNHKEVEMDSLNIRNGLYYEVNSQTPFTGNIYKKLPNEQFILKGALKDGLQDGKWESYYENGQLQSESDIIKGKLNGKSIRFFENGQMKSNESYIDNELQGVSEYWYSNGTQSKKINYKEGKILSEKYWNEDGSERPLLKDALKGIWDGSFDDDYGREIHIFNFINDSLVNIELNYIPNNPDMQFAAFQGKYISPFKIVAYDRFSYTDASLSGKKESSLGILYLSKEKMIVNHKLVNGKYKEFLKK